MSRSYKHFPCYKQTTRKMKTLINRKVRRKMKQIVIEIGNNKFYKKMFCSWDICDHKSQYFWYEFVQDYYKYMSTRFLKQSYFFSSYIYYHRWYIWK